MIEFTNEELALISDLLTEVDLSGSERDKIAMAIQRKIEIHFGWNWNG